MNSYEIMIRDAMQNGSTQEEIAKAFTDAMNRISEANAADRERDNLLDEIESTFYGNVEDGVAARAILSGQQMILLLTLFLMLSQVV